MSSQSSSRRRFLRHGALGGAAILGCGAPWLRGIGRAEWARVSAEEAKTTTAGRAAVTLRPEIEPLVRLLEETPRERVVESVAAKIKAGTSYREVLAALLLAGVRNVQPRPYVGFKFHCVLVVNSAHQASLSSPDADRWLPILWAIDYFKGAQAKDVSEGDWTLAEVDAGKLPPPHRARNALVTALDAWDEEAADLAVASLARTASLGEIFELLWRYGARDYRSIGHKAIYVANSFRTLQTIGHQHAEPVLRSLVYALLQYSGENPAKSDHEADRPFRRNLSIVDKMKPTWRGGRDDAGATNSLRLTFREGSAEDASRETLDVISRGVSPQCVWDAMFVAAAELVVRQPRIVPLHALTTANAIHFAYHATSDDATRRLLLLQAASFLPMFRDSAKGRGKLPAGKIEDLVVDPSAKKTASLDGIFSKVRGDRSAASRELLGYLAAGNSARDVIAAARVLIFHKARDAHDYKFSSAVLEDYYHISPRWRDRFLAASLSLLRGSSERDTSLVARVRAAFSS